MQYGIYEIIRNSFSLIATKIFHPKARLIRYPCYIRNGNKINFGKGFTCGYFCRFECIHENNRYGKIRFGKNVKIGDRVHIASASSVQIGNNVLLASNILITDLDHGSYSKKTQDSPHSPPDSRKLNYSDVIIEDNVWIGENVVILKGCNIGYGSIVGANSLVNKDIQKNCIVAGQPAKVIKIYNEELKKWEKVE